MTPKPTAVKVIKDFVEIETGCTTECTSIDGGRAIVVRDIGAGNLPALVLELPYELFAMFATGEEPPTDYYTDARLICNTDQYGVAAITRTIEQDWDYERPGERYLCISVWAEYHHSPCEFTIYYWFEEFGMLLGGQTVHTRVVIRALGAGDRDGDGIMQRPEAPVSTASYVDLSTSAHGTPQ